MAERATLKRKKLRLRPMRSEVAEQEPASPPPPNPADSPTVVIEKTRSTLKRGGLVFTWWEYSRPNSDRKSGWCHLGAIAVGRVGRNENDAWIIRDSMAEVIGEAGTYEHACVRLMDWALKQARDQ